MRELEDEPSDDVVDPRAQSPARDNAAPEPLGFEIDAVPGTRQFECGGAKRLVAMGDDRGLTVVQENTVGVANVVNGLLREPVRERRRVPARAQDPDFKVARNDPAGALRNGQGERHAQRIEAPPFRVTFATITGEASGALPTRPIRLAYASR